MMKLNLKNSAIAMALTSLTAIASGCGSAPMPAAPVSVAAVAPVGAVGGVMMGGAGQCVPLNQPISFQAPSVTIDRTETLYAGLVPAGDRLTASGQYGQVIQSVGGVAAPLPGSQVVQTSPMGTHPDGTVLINLVSTLPIGGSGIGSANGRITISPAKLTVIYGLFGLSYPNIGSPYMGSMMGPALPLNGPGMMNQQAPCVSGIALSLSVASLVPGNYIDGGRIYLYLNGSSTIANLVF